MHVFLEAVHQLKFFIVRNLLSVKSLYISEGNFQNRIQLFFIKLHYASRMKGQFTPSLLPNSCGPHQPTSEFWTFMWIIATNLLEMFVRKKQLSFWNEKVVANVWAWDEIMFSKSYKAKDEKEGGLVLNETKVIYGSEIHFVVLTWCFLICSSFIGFKFYKKSWIS